ncbi:MAG: hypothetical protein M1829_006579 [Trizodia sp. TS-e1964]|nr:MAG: hypothetical protein M1829_006579 [Trizodia sp. TS-e1964]
MAALVYTVIGNYDIIEKLLLVTSNSASNNDTLVKHLYNRLLLEYNDTPNSDGIEKPLIRFQGGKGQIRCIAHVINMVVKVILTELDTGSLKDAQGHLNQDLEDDNNFHDISTTNTITRLRDWEYISHLQTILKSFYETTQLVSDGHSSIASILYIYQQLEQHIQKIINSEINPTILAAMYSGLAKLQKYQAFLDETLIFYIGSILDPRVKSTWLENNTPNGANTLVKVKEYIKTLYQSEAISITCASNESRPEGNNRTGLRARIYQQVRGHIENPEISDVDIYFDTPVVDYEANELDLASCLDWWKIHAKEYPIMS